MSHNNCKCTPYSCMRPSSRNLIINDPISLSQLSLSTTADPNTFTNVGDIINFTYILTNTGPVPVNGPIILSNLQLGLFGSFPLTNNSLLPGDSVTLTLPYTVTQGNVDAGYVFATARAVSIDGITASSFITILRSTIGSLQLIKSSDTQSFNAPGDVIIYTFTIVNNGTSTLLGPFNLSDPRIGADLQILGPLQPGLTLINDVAYIVTENDVIEGNIVNQGNVTDLSSSLTVLSNTLIIPFTPI